MNASQRRRPTTPQRFVDNEKPTCKNLKFIFQLESRLSYCGEGKELFLGTRREETKIFGAKKLFQKCERQIEAEK